MNSRLLNQLVENKIKYNFVFTLIAKYTSKMRCLIIIIYNYIFHYQKTLSCSHNPTKVLSCRNEIQGILLGHELQGSDYLLE